MTDNNAIIGEYQQLLIGKRMMMSSDFFIEGTLGAHNNAVLCLKYAVEKVLGWSPQEMFYKFNAAIAEMLKLSFLLSRIFIPPEADPTDYFIYAYVLYPGKIDFDRKQLSLITYKKIINGEAGRRFPRGFFDDEHGRERAVACLNYVLTQKENFTDKQALYAMFASPAGRNLLKKHRLWYALANFDDAIEFLDGALPEASKSKLWYNFYKTVFTMPKIFQKK